MWTKVNRQSDTLLSLVYINCKTVWGQHLQKVIVTWLLSCSMFPLPSDQCAKRPSNISSISHQQSSFTGKADSSSISMQIDAWIIITYASVCVTTRHREINFIFYFFYFYFFGDRIAFRLKQTLVSLLLFCFPLYSSALSPSLKLSLFFHI